MRGEIEINATTEARFLKKVAVDEGDPTKCWLWLGCTHKSGYGRFAADGRADGVRNAHNVAWILYRGEIPDDRYVLHHCDVRHCVNPEHLFLGTMQDNSTDMVNKDRQRKGEAHGNSKVTEADVLAIRASSATYDALGEKYGIHPKTVWAIRTRKTWRHI